MEDAKGRERLWTFPFVYLMAVATISSTAFAMVNPTIAKYAVGLGADLSVAGLVAGLFALTALVARPVSGLLADRVDRKWMLVATTALMGLATLGYSLSATLPALLAFRVLHGFVFSLSSTVNMALASTVIPRSRLGEGVGYYGLGMIFSLAVGPALGLALGDAYGLPVAFAIAGAVLLLDALAMAWIPRRRPSADEAAAPRPARSRIRFADLLSVPLLPYALIGGSFSFYNGSVTSFLVLVGEQRTIPGIALYFTVYAVVLLFVRPVVGKVFDRKGLGFILFPAFIGGIAATVLLATAQSIAPVVAAAVLYALAQGAAQPALQATCLRSVPHERNGVATSTYYLGLDVGQGVGPIAGGAVSGSYGYGAMYFGCGALFAVAAAAYGVLMRRRRKPAAVVVPDAEEEALEAAPPPEEVL